MLQRLIAIVVGIFALGHHGWTYSGGNAANVSNFLSQFRPQIWNNSTGLPQNTILSLAQTSDGYLWVGTEVGLARFDGLHFNVFSKANTPELSSNRINALLRDRRGDLWIGTQGGITRFREGRFESFTTRDGLSSDTVSCLMEDFRGDIWVGTETAGLSRYHDGRFTAVTTEQGLSDNHVLALQQGQDGAIWIGTHNGLSSYFRGQFRTFRTAEGLPSNFIRSLLATPQGLWIGTDGGLSQFDNGKFSNLQVRDGLSSNAIASLLMDAHGTLWIGTLRGGLNRLMHGEITAYTARDGLPENDVWSLLSDRSGDLWAGTGGGGLVRLEHKDALTTYGVNNGLSNDVALPVFQDREGVFWIGTNGGGLNRYKDGKFSTITTRDGLADDTVFSLCEDTEGWLWVGTRKGITRIKNKKIQTFSAKDGLPGNAVALYADSAGTIWIGTRAGLARWKDNHFTTFTEKDGLSSDVIRVLLEDRKHRLWIGTRGGGLNLLENGHFTTFNSHSGLSSDIVLALYETPQGTLWIGTDGGGLDRLRDGQFTTFSSRDGLLDDTVFRIFQDGTGGLWMSGNKGISRVQENDLDAFKARRLRRIPTLSLGTNDGMRTNECNGGIQPAGWKANDGRLWFPTMKGVVVVDPVKFSGTVEPQPTVIETLILNQKVVETGSRLEVPVGNGNIEVHYNAPNLRSAARISFQYRLTGFDSDWIDAGQRRIAYYTNIPPGHYQFQVRATNPDNSWSSYQAGFPFTFRPQFYQSPFFFVFCSLGLVGIASFGHRAYVRQLRERERVLEQHVHQRTADLRKEIAERELAQCDSMKAREAAERASRVKSEFLANMSHEIRTPMNGIVGMTRLALGTDLTSEQRQFIEIIKESADSLLIVIDDILDFSKVEAGKLELHPIEFNLRESLDSVVKSIAYRADQKGVDLRLRVQNEVPHLICSDPVRLRQVVLNLLGNALKFTDRGGVTITVSCDEAFGAEAILRVVVEDTGIGIANDKLTSIFDAFSQADSSTTRKFGGTGLGLAICYRLVRLMGGRIWATSELGRGSQFHFTTRVGVSAWEESVSEGSPGEPAIRQESFAALAQRGLSGARVLLAEDNPANRMVARFTLEAAGFKVLAVENGSEAVSAARESKFDLILMDCRMPVMDGYDAAEKIRALPGEAGKTPILALTASAFQEDRDRANRAGMNDFIVKPFEDSDLLQKCTLWIRSTRLQGTSAPMQAPEQPKPSSEAALSKFDRYSPEFLKELFEVFLQSAPTAYQELVAAVRREDWQRVRERAHWLRGGATRVVGDELQARVAAWEQVARSEFPRITEEEIAQTSRLFRDACLTAETWLAKNLSMTMN